MNRFYLALLVTALFAVNNVAAFTSLKTPMALTNSQTRAVTPIITSNNSPVETSISAESSSTALHLKVKIDPKAAAGKNTKGQAKAAAYGGSIAIAAALPIIFLVWSALK